LHKYYRQAFTSVLLLVTDDAVLVSLSNLVTTTVRVMRGSVTKSKLLPSIVTSVPPLYTSTHGLA